jgi:hypothetical protein
MKAKLVTTICVLVIGFGSTAPSYASEDNGPGAGAMFIDVVVARPACLVATVVCSGVFVVALPAALMSKSVKKAANTLVVKPANDTFTRPLGDLKALDADD